MLKAHKPYYQYDPPKMEGHSTYEGTVTNINKFGLIRSLILPRNTEENERNIGMIHSFFNHIAIKTNEPIRPSENGGSFNWHEENRMGSLEPGKLANITVFDNDFMKDDFAEMEKAKCLATYVDGELVYKA